MGVLEAQNLIFLTAQQVSVFFVFYFGIFLGILAALWGLHFGVDRMMTWIYNYGGAMRSFGKPRWKGYNRFRSEKWNMEHTL